MYWYQSWAVSVTEIEVSPYAHLIKGAASGLPCARCFEFEGVTGDLDVATLWHVAANFFERRGVRPEKVSYRTLSERDSSEMSASTFVHRRLAELSGQQIGSLTVGTREPDEIDATWAPRVYAAYGYRGRERGLFFYDERQIDESVANVATQITSLAPTLDFALAWGFDYPRAFSPLAYFWGLSYEPNTRGRGSTLKEDRERVARWMDHCHSGRSVSEGYLRDVYPEVLVRRPILNVERQTFETWVNDAPWRGQLEQVEFGAMWRTPWEHLRRVQSELDGVQMLLSGFRPA